MPDGRLTLDKKIAQTLGKMRRIKKRTEEFKEALDGRTPEGRLARASIVMLHRELTQLGEELNDLYRRKEGL